MRSVLLFLLLSAVVWAQPQALPDPLTDALQAGTSVELLSIHPVSTDDSESFMGFPILGRAKLGTQDAAKARMMVLQGLKEADRTSKAGCFAPRHALIVDREKLLICYQCRTVLVQTSDGKRRDLAITQTGNSLLAGLVAKYDMPWQGWQPVGEEMRHRSGLSVRVPEGFEAQLDASSDTLTLESLEQAVQEERMPGALSLVDEETGKSETIRTEWIDHSNSANVIWYASGLSSTYVAASNTRVCKGSPYALDHVRRFAENSDQPARLTARIKIEPSATEHDLERQRLRFQRSGVDLNRPHSVANDVRALWGGLTTDLALGVVDTGQGQVMVTSIIPVGLPNPLADIVRELKSR